MPGGFHLCYHVRGRVIKGSECSELLNGLIWKTGMPIQVFERRQSQFRAPVHLWEVSDTTDLTGTSSQGDKCQQGKASLFLQHRSDTRNKPCQQQNCLNNQIQGKSICLFLHPKSYLTSSWPTFIYCMGKHCTSKSLQSNYFVVCIPEKNPNQAWIILLRIKN